MATRTAELSKTAASLGLRAQAAGRKALAGAIAHAR